jgi:hypothetical protein
VSEPRGIEERLDWFRSHNPSGPGMCSQHTWHALGGDKGNPPAWGCSDANECVDKVKKSGRAFTDGIPPRGAWVGWKYGSNGHAALSNGDGTITTTDPSNGKPTGVEPLDYPRRWGYTGSADYTVWSDQYNGVRFDVGDDMSNNYDYGFHGAESVLKVTGSYVKLVGSSEWNPSRDGLQFAKLYFKATNIVFKDGKHAGGLKYKCVRENPTDPTFYNIVPIHVDWLDGGEFNHSFSSFESGQDERNLHWEVQCVGGLASCSLATTRYAGWAVVGD